MNYYQHRQEGLDMQLYRAGIDIGSTTVKLVLLDEKGEIVFGKYIRHRAHTREALGELLQDALKQTGECELKVKITGSGSINLGKALESTLCRRWWRWPPPCNSPRPRPTWP